MRKPWLSSLSLGFVLAAAAAATAGAEEQSILGVEVKVWNPKLGAEVRSSTDAVKGTSIDLQSDLNMDNSEVVPCLKLTLGGSQRLALSAMRLRFEGQDQPDTTFSFGGKTFTTAFDVKTNLDANIYRVAWEADWISGLDVGFAKVRLGTIMGTEIFDTSVSLKSDNPLIGKEEENLAIPVPVVGLQGEVTLPFGLGVYGEVAGMYAKRSDFEGSFLEAEAGLRYTIWKAFAEVGWRQLNINLADSDSKASLRFGGPVVGLGIRF